MGTECDCLPLLFLDLVGDLISLEKESWSRLTLQPSIDFLWLIPVKVKTGLFLMRLATLVEALLDLLDKLLPDLFSIFTGDKDLLEVLEADDDFPRPFRPLEWVAELPESEVKFRLRLDREEVTPDEVEVLSASSWVVRHSKVWWSPDLGIGRFSRRELSSVCSWMLWLIGLRSFVFWLKDRERCLKYFFSGVDIVGCSKWNCYNYKTSAKSVQFST